MSRENLKFSLTLFIKGMALQDSSTTLAGRGLNMETREARYGKPVAQKIVRMLNASI
jgi:hypothetical protein